MKKMIAQCKDKASRDEFIDDCGYFYKDAVQIMNTHKDRFEEPRIDDYPPPPPILRDVVAPPGKQHDLCVAKFITKLKSALKEHDLPYDASSKYCLQITAGDDSTYWVPSLVFNRVLWLSEASTVDGGIEHFEDEHQ